MVKAQPTPPKEKPKFAAPRDKFKTFSVIAIFICIIIAVVILMRDNKDDGKKGKGAN